MKYGTISQAELLKSYNRAVKSIGEQLSIYPWHNEEMYARWLAQTYYMVQHTTRFLCYTASQFAFDDDQYHAFCLSHLREETGHELLALYDLQSFDKNIENYPPSLETEMMIQSQYYWIQKNPLNHFGFFWILEKLSVTYAPKMIEKIHKSHGKHCTQFLDLHAAEDIQHVQDISDRVASFPATSLVQLERNINQTGQLYTNMLINLQVDKVYRIAS